MDRIIRADLFRYAGKTSLFKGFKEPGFTFMFFFRKARKHAKKPIIGFFYSLLVRRFKYKFGFQIPISTKIGEGFYIGHFGSVVINRHAVIGKHCNVAHGTTIGRTNRGKTKGFPTIGDRVWIGTGSVIVGGITIGSNVLIAPNTFVNMDVPDNSLVIGSPARVIEKYDATEGYINHILP